MAQPIGEVIRAARRGARLTQNDTARRAGMSRSYISRLEAGNIASPSADFLFRIGRALGVHPDDFFRAAGYTPFAGAANGQRVAALDWLRQETDSWADGELLHWARVMVRMRSAAVEWERNREIM